MNSRHRVPDIAWAPADTLHESIRGVIIQIHRVIVSGIKLIKSGISGYMYVGIGVVHTEIKPLIVMAICGD